MTFFGAGSSLGSWEFWAPALTVVMFILLAMGLLYVLSVTMLMPPSSNRTMPLRIYMVIAWLITGAAAALWAAESGSDDPIYGWASGWAYLFAAAFILVVSEREVWGPRVRKKIPRSLLLRPVAFVFYTGAAGGVCWCVLMITLTLLAASWWPRSATYVYSGTEDMWVHTIVISLYAYAYAMTGVLFRRLVLRDRPDVSYTGVIALFLLALGCALPLLAAFFIHGSEMGRFVDNPGWWMLANPFMVFESDCQDLCAASSAIWAAGMFVVSLPWLLGQTRRFRPYSTPSTIPETVDNG